MTRTTGKLTVGQRLIVAQSRKSSLKQACSLAQGAVRSEPGRPSDETFSTETQLPLSDVLCLVVASVAEFGLPQTH
jgi:hypothetical protein